MQTMHPSHPSPEDVLAEMGEDLPSGSPSRQLPSDRRGHRSQHLSVLLKTNPTPQPVQSSVCPALLHPLGQSPAPEDQGSSLNPGGETQGCPVVPGAPSPAVIPFSSPPPALCLPSSHFWRVSHQALHVRG